jgi:hypothetical protein
MFSLYDRDEKSYFIHGILSAVWTRSDFAFDCIGIDNG